MSLYSAWAFQIIIFQIFLKIFVWSNMAKFYDFQIKKKNFILYLYLHLYRQVSNTDLIKRIGAVLQFNVCPSDTYSQMKNFD